MLLEKSFQILNPVNPRPSTKVGMSSVFFNPERQEATQPDSDLMTTMVLWPFGHL